MRRAELSAGDGDKTAAIALAERAVAADDTPRSLLLRYADLAREAEDDAAAERAYRRLEASLGDDEADPELRAAVSVARAGPLGRAARRRRSCQCVKICVGAVSCKTKTTQEPPQAS